MGKFRSSKSNSNSGRPKGEHGGLTLEEKREYFRIATARSRMKATTQYLHVRSRSRSTPPTSQEPSTPKKVGRPPLKDNAMTPNTLRKHKRDSLSAKRNITKLPDKRRQAANKRWQMRIRPFSMDDDDEILNEPDEEEILNGTDEGEKQNGTDDNEKLNETDEGERPNETERDENAMSVIEEGNTEPLKSERTKRRAICQLIGLLPSNVFDSTKLFLRIYQQFVSPELKSKLIDAAQVLQSSGKLSSNQLKYISSLIYDVFQKRSEFLNDMLRKWLHVLLQHSVIEAVFDSSEVILPSEVVPKSLSLARRSREICKEVLSTSSHTKANAQHVAIELAVKVAKSGNLRSERYGDISLLSDTISCTWRYAKRILVSIENGTEDDLITVSTKCTSIHASKWPSELTKYVLLPENSRSIPGQDSISIRYGVRHAKYILLKSRAEIASKFKEEHPDCTFSISTLMREFPQYAVTPTSRDLERNTCPTHANVRRLIKVINNKFQHKIPTSCRSFALSLLCPSPVATVDPLTWNTHCVTGECGDCPGLKLTIPDKKILKEMVTFSQWASKKQLVTIKGEQKDKYVFSLYTETVTLSDAIERLEKLSMPLALHIFTAAKQWDAHDTIRKSLDRCSIISIEDYQKNVEAVYSENPTSLAYSGNKVTVALYPICVEYVGDDGSLKKGAIAFLSDDKDHDHQQARNFETRMFAIVREHLRRPILNWKRYSDGCDGQFRSRFTVADLMKACERFGLQRASFDFFEANEGKNISDTIGSIVKCAYIRGMHKHERGIHSVRDVVSVIKSELRSETEKFEFFIIEEFGRTARVKNRDSCAIDGIMKIHSLATHEDKVIVCQWTCTKCTVNIICEECKHSDCYVDTTDVSLGEDDDCVLRDRIYDDDDEGQTDVESEDDGSSVEDEDIIAPGDIVWGLCGRIWYPAKVCSLTDLPLNLQQRFRNNQRKLILKWYGEDNYSLVNESKVERLAENNVDAQRASKSATMLVLYNTALVDLLQ